jgi:hypothetical protein
MKADGSGHRNFTGSAATDGWFAWSGSSSRGGEAIRQSARLRRSLASALMR